jgi:hypothetical protein
MNTFALAILATAASGQAHEHGPGKAQANFEVASLAKNLDDAIKVCSSIIVSTTNKAGPYRPEQVVRQNGRMIDIANPDAGLSSFANPKYGPANFASWFDPHSVVVMMSYRDTPYCRVFVEGAAWVNEIRPELERLVLVDDFWRVEKLGEQTPAGQRSVFKAQLPKGEAILTITGFDTMKGTIAVVLTAEKPTNP